MSEPTSASASCPCGSGLDETGCCGPIIAGAAAPTAEALMRSRYTAYVRGTIDHVAATHDAATRDQVDRAAALQWAKDTEWKGLEILATERGTTADSDGIVEFVARGITNGTPFAQRERSQFKQVDGRWYYVDGKVIRERAKKTVTAGRNDPCPCGSGMKFKRCHGR